MIRWILSSLAALAIFGGCAYAGYQFGVTQERARMLAEQVAQLDKDLDGAEQEIDEARAWGAQMVEGTKRVADAVSAAERSGTRYVEELGRALENADLGACLLPADVQRLRAARYAEARAAAGTAREAH